MDSTCRRTTVGRTSSDDFMGLFEAYQDPQNPKADWSSGDIDVRNSFTVGGVYNAPRIPRLPRKFGEGWQVTSIVQGRTATPVNFSYSLYDPHLNEPATGLCFWCFSAREPLDLHQPVQPRCVLCTEACLWNLPTQLWRGTNYIQRILDL